MQTRNEAINWCKEYLPKWPDINHAAVYNDLPRPMAWKWVNKRMPYLPDGELVLINGKDDCIPIRESHVWPPAPAAPPPFLPPLMQQIPVPPPAPVPIIFPEHVNKFIDALKKMVTLKNESNEITDVYHIIMNQDEFDKLCKDYPPVGIMCNKTRTEAVIQGISIVVVDADVLSVIKFITMPGISSLFNQCLESNTGINSNIDDGTVKRILEKLISAKV